MKASNVRFLLFIGGIIFFVSIFVFSIIMMSKDITVVYGAEPSPTFDWGYPIVTPTIEGYPVPMPTENNGYPAPEPIEIGGYPVPIPSDPIYPTPVQVPMAYYSSDYKSEHQSVSQPFVEKIEIIIKTIIQFIKPINSVEHHGKTILEMR